MESFSKNQNELFRWKKESFSAWCSPALNLIVKDGRVWSNDYIIIELPSVMDSKNILIYEWIQKMN